VVVTHGFALGWEARAFSPLVVVVGGVVCVGSACGEEVRVSRRYASHDDEAVMMGYPAGRSTD